MSPFQLIADAAPAATAPAAGSSQPGGGLMGMVPFFIIIGVMMFLMIRSQKKQQQKRQQMLDRIAKGAKVLLGGGMIGTVIEVKGDDRIVVEIAPGVRVEVIKSGIGDVIESPVAADPKAN